MQWQFIIIYLIPSVISLLSLNLVKIKGTDHYYHEMIINAIKSNNNRFIKENPYFIGKNIMAYPQFLHWMLSFFNNRHIPKYAFFINFFSTLGSSLALFWFVNVLLQHTVIVPEEMKSTIVFLTGLAYAVFPSNYDMVNAKNMGISARGIGLFLGQLYLYLICFFIINDSNIYLLLAVPICILIVLSSTFCIQFIFFLTPLIAIISNRYFILLPLIVSLLAIYIIAPGFFSNFFKGQYNHKKLYNKYLAKRYILAARYSIWRDFVYDFWIKLIDKKLSIVNKVKYISSNPFIVVIISMPLIIFSGFCLISIASIPVYLLYFSIGCFVIFIITSFRYTRFLGEPERYLEFGIGFFCIIAAIGSRYYPSLFWILIIYSITFIFFRLVFYISYIKKNKNVQKRNSALEAKALLYNITVGNSEGIKVLSNSTQLSKILFDDRWQVFWHPLYQEKIGSYHFMDLFSGSYDYISEQKLAGVIYEFDINYFLCDRKYLFAEEVFFSEIAKTSFSVQPVAHYGDDLILFKICPKN